MKRDLVDLADDFEWHTGIPLLAVLLGLSLLCSVAAIVIAVVAR